MPNVYSQLKIFHFKEKLDSLPQGVDRIRPPIHIRVKPTNACNHNCRYCAYRVDNLQLGQHMRAGDYIPADKMMEMIADWADMGVRAITFSGGGEPLIYPYMTKTLQRLMQTDIAFATLTNGSRLEGETAELLAAGGTWVRISIDGWDAASYAAYRGVTEDSFARVMANMQAFKKLDGACTLGVAIVVDALNHGRIYDMVRRFRDAGADSVKVSPCIVSNDGAANNRYHRPFFQVVKEAVARAKTDFGDRDFILFDAYHELDEKFDKPYNWCPYCQILPVIGADQNVYTCQDKAYNLNRGLLGSLSATRFSDFWLANKAKFFAVNPSIDCRHHCVANNKNRMVLDYLDAGGAHLGFV
ncbi:MAG: radical SAM protein [Desulfobacterales bacterium]|nr:radical SAM protein [Desulfobacterales bacterium]